MKTDIITAVFSAFAFIFLLFFLLYCYWKYLHLSIREGL